MKKIEKGKKERVFFRRNPKRKKGRIFLRALIMEEIKGFKKAIKLPKRIEFFVL